MPPPIVAQLSTALNAVLRTPEMEKALREMGTDPDRRSRDEYIVYVKGESSKYARRGEDARG